MKFFARKCQSLPQTPTPCSWGGFTSSRPGRFFKDLCKNLAYALLVIGLMLAIIALGMWQVGEGKVKSGPLTVPKLSKEEIKARLKYHGTRWAYRCNRPNGWCFVRNGQGMEL